MQGRDGLRRSDGDVLWNARVPGPRGSHWAVVHPRRRLVGPRSAHIRDACGRGGFYGVLIFEMLVGEVGSTGWSYSRCLWERWVLRGVHIWDVCGRGWFYAVFIFEMLVGEVGSTRCSYSRCLWERWVLRGAHIRDVCGRGGFYAVLIFEMLVGEVGSTRWRDSRNEGDNVGKQGSAGERVGLQRWRKQSVWLRYRYTDE